MPSELTKLITSVDETSTQDYVFVESGGDIKKISRNKLLPYYIQAGHLSVSTGTATVTFSTEFETLPRVVAAYSTGGSTTYENYNEIVITDVTKQGFKVKLVGGYAGTFTIDWMAFAGESIPDQILADEISAVATTLSPGTPATAAVVETADGIELQFGIPQGATGATGPQGPQGPTGNSGLTVVAVTGDVSDIDDVDCAKMTGCYDDGETFVLRFIGTSRKDYIVIESYKTTVSENVDRYDFNLFRKDNYGNPGSASNQIETVLLSITRTQVTVDTYSYSVDTHSKTLYCENTSKRIDTYNASEASPGTKYYSVLGTWDAINAMDKFSRYTSFTATSGTSTKTFTWLGTGQTSTKIPSALWRITVEHAGPGGTTHTEIKDFDVSYVYSSDTWTATLTFAEALASNALVELWSDTDFYR